MDHQTTNVIPSVLYHPARRDRSGSVIQDMLLAHAYAYQNNFTYGGACLSKTTPPSTLSQHQRLVETIGLSDVLQFTCPSNSSNDMWVDPPTYTRFGTRILTHEWLKYIRSSSPNKSTPPTGDSQRKQMVVHVRRGDVSLCDPQTFDRYLPNAHYLKLMSEHGSAVDTDVTIYSETNSTEAWQDFLRHRPDVTLHLSASPVAAWQAMMQADVLILSWSSFSIVPALLNPQGQIVYTPFWVQPLSHWYVVEEDAVRVLQRTKIRLRSQLCESIHDE